MSPINELSNLVELTEEESEYWDDPRSDDNLPFRISPYYASLIEKPASWESVSKQKGRDPVRIQTVPNVQELNIRNYETSDPLGEGYHTPVPGLIHQYPDRILIKVTDRCATYCRHCFRRSFSGGTAGDITPDRIEAAAAYLKSQPGVREVLLSGGDCLSLSDENLGDMIDMLSAGQRERTFRICTRMPVVNPSRISIGLVELLSARAPVWVATQFNHPRELSGQAVEALERFIAGGIPVVNQAVLLRGVNDAPDILAELFSGLVALGVKPYYLFQGDLAAGTAHLRVPLKRGLKIVRELRYQVSGLAMPVYAVDLPRGGGKVILTDRDFLRDDPPGGEDNPDELEGWRVFEGPGGGEYRYPLEKEI